MLIMLTYISSIMVIGTLNVMLKVKNSATMKLRQSSTLATTLILVGAVVVKNPKTSGNIRQQVKVTLAQNSTTSEISNGMVTCPLRPHRFGVTKF